MIRSQRRRHLLIWLTLGPLLVILLAWLLSQRPGDGSAASTGQSAERSP